MIAMMKVLMVLDKDFPPDVRVEREAKTLAKAGYELHLLARNRDKRRKRNEKTPYLEVHRLPYLSPKWGKLARLLNKPVFFNPLYLAGLIPLVFRYKPTILHVHDLPLVLAVAVVSKFSGAKVIFDMHEDYPAMVRASQLNRGAVGSTFFYRALRLLEKASLSLSHYVLVVTEEQSHRLISLGVPAERVFVIGNTIDLSMLKPFEILKEKARKELRLVYTGRFGLERGLDVVLRALPKILESQSVKLLMVGDGKITGDLKDLCRRLGVAEHVMFTGWLNGSEMLRWVFKSDVCLVPHLSTAHTKTTLPNKLFEYMALGKPVVVADADPLKRIVEETGCGIVTPSGQADRLSEAVLKLRDPVLREQLGQNGKRAIKEKYNWEVDGRRLRELYQRIQSRRFGRPAVVRPT